MIGDGKLNEKFFFYRLKVHVNGLKLCSPAKLFFSLVNNICCLKLV